MKTTNLNFPKIIVIISGILYGIFMFLGLAGKDFLSQITLNVLICLFIVAIISMLGRITDLRFYFVIYIFSETIWLLSNLSWTVDTYARKIDPLGDPFFVIPSFLFLVMQTIAIGYLTLAKYTSWNRYSFSSKYFLVLFLSILLTNRLSSVPHNPTSGDAFQFITLVCIMFIFANIFTIAISIHEAVRYPSFILYILGYYAMIFGNYMYLVSGTSVLAVHNHAIPLILITGGNYLLVLSFYFEERYPWLSFTIDEKDIDFNKKLYIFAGAAVMVIFDLLFLFHVVEAKTAMVASLIGLIFIFMVSEQHSRMLTEQLYVQKKAENDHLEKLVERRTNALRITNQQLAEAVITDALTGLYNRCEYMNQIHRRIDENNTSPVSILCANIHNFKHYNVEYGYATGDVILGEIGKRLLTMDGDRFKSFRIDGNEFLIMTWGEYEKAEIEELLRYIRHLIEEPIIDGKQIYKLDVTFSYAMYPQDTDKLDQLLGFAETSLLKAKNNV